jgi:hypothetical protein
MISNTSTLRPGLLVSLKTSTAGNVAYDKRDIERDHMTKKGERLAKWETERKIADPAEWERSQDVRSKSASMIRSVCSWSAFGLLCPEADAERLETAIRDARKLVQEFNDSAKITRLSVNVLTGRIAPDDVEAVRAINSEIRDLMADMEAGLQNLDVKAVRAAAQKAKGIGNMLTPNAQARIQVAIDLARKSAKEIVKAGEKAAVEVDRATIRKIKDQRVAFLELDEQQEIAKPKAKARAVELTPEDREYNAENKKRGKEIDRQNKKYFRPTLDIE